MKLLYTSDWHLGRALYAPQAVHDDASLDRLPHIYGQNMSADLTIRRRLCTMPP